MLSEAVLDLLSAIEPGGLRGRDKGAETPSQR